MKVEKVISVKTQLADSIHNIYNNAARFYWDYDFVQSGIENNLYQNPAYKRLPRYAKEYLMGVLDECRRRHNKLLVFSYEVDGVRMAITDKKYREIPAQKVHEKWTETGAFVYKENTAKIWR